MYLIDMCASNLFRIQTVCTMNNTLLVSFPVIISYYWTIMYYNV